MSRFIQERQLRVKTPLMVSGLSRSGSEIHRVLFCASRSKIVNFKQTTEVKMAVRDDAELESQKVRTRAMSKSKVKAK